MRSLVLGLLLVSRFATAAPLADEAIRAAQSERDPQARKFQLAAIVRGGTLTRAQKRTAMALVRDPERGLLPKRPLLPKEGTIEVRLNFGREFFDKGVQSLVEQGFEFRDSTNEGLEASRGRLHLLIDTGAHNLLRDLRDPNVHAVIFSGHSELGGVVERAVRAGSLDMRSSKLVALLQCKGLQTLPLISAAMPNAHVLTTIDYSYLMADQQMTHALLDGLEHGETYAQMRNRVAKEQREFLFPQRFNYLFPDRAAQLKHMDFDRSGELDGEQADPAFAKLSPEQQHGAQRLMSGVSYLRNMNAYYVEEVAGAAFSREQVKKKVRAAGIVRGDGASVTHIVERGEGEQKIFEVGLDEKYATADPAFVGAATVYELQLHLGRALLGESNDKARTRALAFAGEYLNRMYDGAEAQHALDKLLAMHALPSMRLFALPSGVHGFEPHRIDALAQKLTTRTLGQRLFQVRN